VIAGSEMSPSPDPTPCPSPAPSLKVSSTTSGAEPPTASSGAAQSIASSSPQIQPSPSGEPCAPEDPKVGLGVGPSQIILSADQGTGTFNVYNAGDLDELVVLTARDFSFDAAGNRVPSELPLAQGAARWLSIEPASFVLPPEATQAVTFTVLIPDDATPGDHVADISVISGFTSAAWERFYRDHPRANTVSFKARVSFAVDVVTRVPGDVIPLIAVPAFETFLPALVTTTKDEFTFSPTITNPGNVAAVWMPIAGTTNSLETMIPTLKLRSTGGLFTGDQILFEGTKTAKAISLSPLVVMPGASHTQELAMTDVPLFGSYDYTYTLPGSVADGRETITRTGHFTIVNLQKVLLWIVLPLLILLVLLTLAMLRRHQTGNKRLMAAALRARELQLARAQAYEQAMREQQAQGRGLW
jgi:hypothetical protein